ncbi:MAG: glycosyl transferase family 2 [Bacteroidetes bacterium GWF2_38_335]|nr:MAG: glycosyl transferase family 2 [Bacteroidetes bacterium GWF2_38_335]OFY81247.1 MAG: glycosyl transferase family 2 [Bacteroidetes bacterium RIFOXYA12_FULL_38_20]HBS85364.1 hypothetical protein [Bacteroidales bacterium]
MIKTAVVILNWNGKALLEKFLPSVVACSDGDDVRIYVADNNSSDDSLEFLKTHYTSVSVICLDKNYGFAGGYNRALEKIEASYFVLLNSDVEVAPGWLTALVKKMDSNEKIAGCAPKILAFNDKTKFEYAGAAGGFIDNYGFTFCRGRVFDTEETDNGQYNLSGSIFWASGACLMIRSSLFLENGGLDEDFFAHMEEIDLCWRLKNMGYKFEYVPESVIYHVGAATLSKASPRKTYLNFRNNLYMLYKNIKPGKLFSTLFVRLILDGVAGLRFFMKGELDNFFSVIEAHFSFYAKLGSLRKKRKIILERSVFFDHPEIYPHSLVFDYYVGKKTHFSQLNFKISEQQNS